MAGEPILGYQIQVIDWYSRYVLAWQLSNTLDGHFCRDALHQALSVGRPEIFNSDQGTQFTAEAFTSILKSAGIAISMDGRGRAHDNIFVAPVGHPLWRSVKYEEIYLKEYREVPALRTGLGGVCQESCVNGIVLYEQQHKTTY